MVSNCQKNCIRQLINHRIGGVTGSVLNSSAVDRGFNRPSGQTKEYKIGICCLFAKHAALSSKSKDGLIRDQGDVRLV